MTSKPTQNRRDVAASRARDAEAGIIRVEVRIPAERREELLKLAARWRAGKNPSS